MNKEPNRKCPACECMGTASSEYKDGVYALQCMECGFQIRALACNVMNAVWAWETLPRPKAKPRKARREGK